MSERRREEPAARRCAGAGLQPRLLRRLERDPPACVVEVQTRLAELYPEYHIARVDAASVASAEGGDDGVLALSYVPAERQAGVTALASEWTLLKRYLP